MAHSCWLRPGCTTLRRFIEDLAIQALHNCFIDLFPILTISPFTPALQSLNEGIWAPATAVAWHCFNCWEVVAALVWHCCSYWFTAWQLPAGGVAPRSGRIVIHPVAGLGAPVSLLAVWHFPAASNQILPSHNSPRCTAGGL